MDLVALMWLGRDGGDRAELRAIASRSATTGRRKTPDPLIAVELKHLAGRFGDVAPVAAATTFSLFPPTGSTGPRGEISPVIALSLRIVRQVRSDTSGINVATAALGPSLGVAPAGSRECDAVVDPEKRRPFLDRRHCTRVLLGQKDVTVLAHEG